MFNFERDHAEIHQELEEPKERGYLREFYMRFTTRGIYPNDIQSKTQFRTIEDELNAKITLKELVVNSILNTNDESFIKSAIDSAPVDTYHTFMRCAIYTLNDFAVQYLVEHWPFESLELIRYFHDAYSSLLLFYCTDISSYTGKIASEVHKWILIGDKYVRMVTKLFLRNGNKEKSKFCRLDISGLPVSAQLFTRLIDIYYKHVFNHQSLFEVPEALTKEDDHSDAVVKAGQPQAEKKGTKRKKENSSDESDENHENENNTSMMYSNDDKEEEMGNSGDDDEESGSDLDRHDFMRCIKRMFFDDFDQSDESDDNDDDEEDDDDSLSNLESVENKYQDEAMSCDEEDQKKCCDHGKHYFGKTRSSRFTPNKTRLVIRLDFDETYSSDFQRFAKCHQYMSEINLTPDDLMFDLNIVRLNMTIQNANSTCIKPSFERVAKRINGLSLFFLARPNETKHVFSIIKHFPNITELNVSAFGSEQQLKSVLSQNSTFKSILKESLASLPNLKRLRLNALDLFSQTEMVLGLLQKPLEYLNLTSCHLSSDDLDYLAHSMHASSVRVLILSNDDLEAHTPCLKQLLLKCARTLEVLDLGCNSFTFDSYMSLVAEIVKIPRLKMLVTLNLFTFDNYLKIADKLNTARNFVAWRLNFSTDYYQQSVKIRSKFKFKKFKNDYLKSLQNKFDSRPVKITINDPDLNYILHEIF